MQVKRRAVSCTAIDARWRRHSAVDPTGEGTKDNDVRKQAMNSLGNSRDGRAVTFFEEVLKK